MYELRAVGKRSEEAIGEEAKRLNRTMPDGTERYSRVEKPILTTDGEYMQYYYHYSETDCNAPARLKYATKDQIAKWPELAAWRDLPAWESVTLLWVNLNPPDNAPEPRVDKHGNRLTLTA